jgi:hypothetical protein
LEDPLAQIIRHPLVDDYILELSLDEIAARHGVADLIEEGQMVLIKDYRLDFDFGALATLAKSIDMVADKNVRRTLKKLQATYFFKGEPPVRDNGRLVFSDPVRQAIFDVICKGDEAIFERTARALKFAHDEAERIFETAFCGYEPFRFIPSLRLTQTLFENLHWDNHSIADDFHQARVFANLDIRPRIWHVSHRLVDYARALYHEHDLGRFSGRDPNLMLDYINGNLLGGTRETWKEHLPKHRIAFDPGEVWLGESRMISHQIFYGEAALVYMWFIKSGSMANADNRFNVRIEQLHEQMRSSAPEVA